MAGASGRKLVQNDDPTDTKAGSGAIVGAADANTPRVSRKVFVAPPSARLDFTFRATLIAFMRWRIARRARSTRNAH